MQRAIDKMVREISSILSDVKPSIYLYGSSVLDDFKLGWSDIDILVLTDSQMSEGQAQSLVGLRQAMLADEPGNLYYCSFEGGMLTLDAFLSGASDRVVYWGTSGERVTDRYVFDSFCMAELVESSVLLYGADIRNNLNYPPFKELYADVKHHYETIRQYAQSTGRSFYTFGWLLDIARCIYTLRTGRIIAKTTAAEWALENNLCPDADAMQYALRVRRNPLNYKEDKLIFDYAETLAVPIQCFADVLEHELVQARGFHMAQWIFFDVGSTLVDEAAAYDHRVRDMISGTSITFQEFDNARIAFAKQGLDGNSAAIKHFGLTKTPWHPEDEVPYSDAHDTLAALCGKGYQLGIIANQSSGTAERLELWGLRKFFGVIAASAEIGYAKPNKKIFERAFEIAGCCAEKSVMVGDRLDNDMIPAKALGMKTVWIKNGLAQYQGAEFGEGIVDYQIKKLSELLCIL